MSRPKVKDEAKILKHYLRIRLDEATLRRLKKQAAKSDCKGVSQYARKVLMEEPIHIFHSDISMNGPMEELALIRKEIKSIGININQQTYHFHVSKSRAEKMFYVERTAIQYKIIESKVDEILEILDKLTKKWLQKL